MEDGGKNSPLAIGFPPEHYFAVTETSLKPEN